MSGSGSRRRGLRTRTAVGLSCLSAAVLAAAGASVAAVTHSGPFGTHRVGQTVAGATLLPTNQWVTPLGTRILDRHDRLLTSTLSPNGKYVAALGWNNYVGNVTVVNVRTHKIASVTDLAEPAKTPTDITVAPDGPLFTSDGRTLWVPQSTYLDRFAFDAATGKLKQTAAITFCGNGKPTSPQCNAGDEAGVPNGSQLPSGMALSPDGATLYVALNGANKLAEVNTATNHIIREIAVGNAPRQVVLGADGTTAYVSNEGGYPAKPGQYTNMSDGTPIVSNKVTGAASTGTVSVVDLATGKQTREIPVGLQPTAMYQKGSALLVANSNDDSLSVIDEATGKVTQTVNTNPVPGAKVGSYANAISMLGDHVLVSIGRDNAIAQYTWHGETTPMSYDGLLPTDFYPVQVQPDPALGKRAVVVTNDKGIGARGPQTSVSHYLDTSVPHQGADKKESVTGHNTYDDTGSVTIFKLPTSSGAVRDDTRKVFTDNAWEDIKAVNQGTDDSVPSVVPRTIGGASPIKHVVVIVKENRTYDQVLGDLGEGNGDPGLAEFGKNITPNLHTLASRFGDYDNFYDEGTLSADGHNWIVQAEANDYNEKEFGAFYRSYPSQGGDALAYQRDGFLWNAAEKAHKSVQVFGEYAHNPYADPPPSWDKWYKDSQILQGQATGKLPVPTHKYKTVSDIPSLNKVLDPWFPNFHLNIPDQYRVDMWDPIFRHQEQTGKFPNLSFLWLMTDHTAGIGTGDPYPVAEEADNDLAVGRVVNSISHSKFWKSTAIFVLEDDPQNGVDHVDGHRSVLWTISPYSKPGVHDDYYSQINVVRTIEQLLGIQPMNQEDHSAAPMYGAFTSKPDFAPYDVLPNRIPLTLGAPGYPSTITSGPEKGMGSVPPSERAIYEDWVRWSRRQPFNGSDARADAENPAQLNRLDWYSAHDWKVAYPGDSRIQPPDRVRGRNLPKAFLGGD